MKIICNQCNHENYCFSFQKVKKCPNCGDSYKDEVMEIIKRKRHIENGWWIMAVLAVIGVILICSMIEIHNRRYSWEENRTTTIVDKETYTTTSDVDVGEVSVPVTTHHYKIHCANGHTEEVEKEQYDNCKVGDKFSYTVTRSDWKPGMKDAPIPFWVYGVPSCVIVFLGVGALIYVKRIRAYQLKMWEETGEIPEDD